MTIRSQKELILLLSKSSRFIKQDIKIILDALIQTLEQLVATESNNFEEGKTEKVLLKVRGLGEMKSILIPERKGKDSQMLPPTTKIIFRLSKNIRFAGRNVESDETDDDADLDSEEESW